MVSNAEPQRRNRQQRVLAAGSDADTRRQRDAALQCERQKPTSSTSRPRRTNTHPPTFHLTTPHQIYKRVRPNMSTKTKLQLGASTVLPPYSNADTTGTPHTSPPPPDSFMEVDMVLPTPPPTPPLPIDVRSARAAATTASDRPGHRSLTMAHWPLLALVWLSALPLPFTPHLPPLSLLSPLVRPSLGHAITRDKAAVEREHPSHTSSSSSARWAPSCHNQPRRGHP